MAAILASAGQVTAQALSALTPGDSAPDNPQNTASPPLLPSSPISEKTHLSGPLFSSSPHVRHKPIKLQTVPQ